MLRFYVEDRLAGRSVRSDGMEVPGPTVPLDEAPVGHGVSLDDGGGPGSSGPTIRT